MKNYDYDMSFGDFLILIESKGLSFPLRRCGSPLFRKRILMQLEKGMTVDEIYNDYSMLFYGVPFPKDKGSK